LHDQRNVQWTKEGIVVGVGVSTARVDGGWVTKNTERSGRQRVGAFEGSSSTESKSKIFEVWVCYRYRAGVHVEEGLEGSRCCFYRTCVP
jgi:hypothetical protein